MAELKACEFWEKYDYALDCAYFINGKCRSRCVESLQAKLKEAEDLIRGLLCEGCGHDKESPGCLTDIINGECSVANCALLEGKE